jgi:acyl-CoA reductase-like NAD-dependent aldehyde dehydrogenase
VRVCLCALLLVPRGGCLPHSDAAQVCVCKTNPVNCSSAPAIARILAPLTEANYLAIVGGGIDVGKALLSDAQVDRLLMTGAARSYDAIL